MPSMAESAPDGVVRGHLRRRNPGELGREPAAFEVGFQGGHELAPWLSREASCHARDDGGFGVTLGGDGDVTRRSPWREAPALRAAAKPAVAITGMEWVAAAAPITVAATDDDAVVRAQDAGAELAPGFAETESGCFAVLPDVVVVTPPR